MIGAYRLALAAALFAALALALLGHPAAGLAQGEAAAASPVQAAAVAPPAPATVLPERRRVRVLEASTLYRRQIEQVVSDLWGLNGSAARLAAQLHQESAFRIRARSPLGAQGLAQFMPATARWIAEVYPDELGQFDPWDPAQAIRAAAVYDRHLVDRNPGATDCDTWAFGLSAYNGGEKYLRRERMAADVAGRDRSRWFGHAADYRVRGPSAFRENREYVRRILIDLEPAYLDAGWAGSAVCA